jgi:nicotinate-nucleotide pyrophosphorylase (carboxylating)
MKCCLPCSILTFHRPDTASDSGVDVSMLAKAVAMIEGKIDTEASGNVTLKTIRAIAETGVTHISVGSITHSVYAQDISLKIKLL